MKLSLDVVRNIDPDLVQKMHELFLAYYEQVGDKDTADIHGAHVKVVRSKCCNYVGVEGTITQELPDKIVIYT